MDLIRPESQNFISALATLAVNNQNPPAEVVVSFLREENSLTIASAYEGNKLYQISRSNNNFAFDIILGLVQATCISLNVKNSLNNFQAMEIVYMILNDFKHLTIESITLAFKNGKSGKYGPTYNRLDIEIVSGWLRSFSSSDEYIDQIEKANRKVFDSDVPVTEKAVEIAAKLKKTVIEAGRQADKERNDSKFKTIRATIRREKLINEVFLKDDKELKRLKNEYEQEGWSAGVNVIDKELQKRKNNG